MARGQKFCDIISYKTGKYQLTLNEWSWYPARHPFLDFVPVTKVDYLFRHVHKMHVKNSAGRQSLRYNASQKHESTSLHVHACVLNEFLRADSSLTAKYF